MILNERKILSKMSVQRRHRRAVGSDASHVTQKIANDQGYFMRTANTDKTVRMRSGVSNSETYRI